MAATRSSHSGRRGGLPTEVTSFVGRRQEMSAVKRMLANSRCVTLTGAGGVGKTRLARRVASTVRRPFPDGTWFVELAELRQPALLTSVIEERLDLRDQSPRTP